MLTIALYVYEPAHEHALQSALAPAYKVAIRRRPQLIVELAANGVADAVITELVRPDGTPALPLIEQVRAVAPRTPILGYAGGSNGQEALMLLPEAVHMGLWGVITPEHHDVLAVVAAALAPASWRTFGELFRYELDALPQGIVRTFCAYLFDHAVADASFDDVSALAGTTSTALRAEFRRYRYGRPRRLFSCVRMLAAVALLNERDRRPEDVAPVLGFRSGDTLRRALTRETGRGARDGYAGDTFDHLVRVIRAQLRGNGAPKE